MKKTQNSTMNESTADCRTKNKNSTIKKEGNMLAFATPPTLAPAQKRKNTAASPQKNPSKTVSARLEARVPQHVLSLVKQAAEAENSTVTDFVVHHLSAAAQDVLLDQTFFTLSEEQMNAFEVAMTAPMSENSALQKLLTSKSPWEK